MEWLRRKWFDILSQLLIAILVVLVTFRLTTGDTNARDLKKTIDAKADITYVDKQDYAIQEKCLSWKQDNDANYNRLYNQNEAIIKRIDELYKLMLEKK